MTQPVRITRWLATACWMWVVATPVWGQDVPTDAFAFRTPTSMEQGLAEPVLRENAVLTADRTTAWDVQKTRYLLLEGNVELAVGVYGFTADRAVIRIDTERRPGRITHRLAAYLDKADALRSASQPRGTAITGQAPRLLVTVATAAKVKLQTDVLNRLDAPPTNALVTQARARMNRYDQAMARERLPAPSTPLFGPEVETTRSAQRKRMQDTRRQDRIRDLRQTQQAMVPRGQADQLARAQAAVDHRNLQQQGQATADPDAPAAPSQAIIPQQVQALASSPIHAVLPTRGVVGFSAERIVGEMRGQESVVMLIGNVRVLYTGDPDRPNVNLQAQRVVLFLDGDWTQAVAGRQVQAGALRGVYLEDNVVATDGQLTLRAPRMFYDLVDNRAVLLEAVLYTFDTDRQIPLYLRAQVLRQTSATSFEAQDAILTSSEFGEPHVSLAAQRIYVDQIKLPSGKTTQQFVSHDTTVRVGQTPVFYWPTLMGRNTEIPLTQAEVGYNNQTGPEVTTTWDLFALAGQPRPDGVTLTGDVDYLGDHRLGTGVDLAYDLDEMFGRYTGYIVPFDDGEDDLGGNRANVSSRSNNVRGSTQWQHRQALRYGVEMSVEAAYVSDPTFLEEFFPDQATQAKSYETSIYLKKQEDAWALTLLASTNLNDFLAQTTTLQSPGYFVEKAPELAFMVQGASLWDDRLTWYSENSVGRMKLQFGTDTPADRGFTPAQSLALFGQPSTSTFKSVAQAAGLPTTSIVRADTRQEIAAPLAVGDLDVVPYVVGRATAYDTDFSAFSGNNDQLRLWGQVGTRLHTDFHRDYANVHSRLFNLTGLRHIIEPSANIYYASTSINSANLPVYDPEVESLNKGAGVTFGLRNTLQTTRGGPGQWRTVDWIVLDTYYTIADDENAPTAPISRFVDYRPEFSTGGDHFYAQALWLVTDSLGVTADMTYGTDANQVVQWRVNAQLEHTPRFSSFLSYQDVPVLGNRLLTFGMAYQFTRKYAARLSQRLDLANNESRTFSLEVERRLPRWILSVFVSVDDIRDRQSFGILLTPDGLGDSIAGQPIRQFFQ